MHTSYRKICILSSCVLLQAGCGDGRELLGPASDPGKVIGTVEQDIDGEIPEEFAAPVDLFLTGDASINESYGSMWALMSAYANRLRLRVWVDLYGTSEGRGEIELSKDWFFPIPRHSLSGTARAGVQAACGGVANGSANAVAYNEAPLTRGVVRFAGNQEAMSKVAAQAACPDASPEDDSVQPIGGGGGGTSGDSGDCVLWGKFVDGVLVYTWFVGADC